MSSFKPLLFASPGLNVPETAPNRPATGEVKSSLIRAVRADAISAADWLAIPSGGTSVSVVSKVYLTPFNVILYLSWALICPAFSRIYIISLSASSKGTGSVG